MTSRNIHFSLALCFASLLVTPQGAQLSPLSAIVMPDELNRELDRVYPDPVCNGGTACFDVTTNGANIGQILIDDICGQTAPEDFLITVDGELITKLHTDDSPCPEIPSDVFFSLPGNQSTAQVCVSVRDAGGDCIRVGAKAGNECFIAAVPLSDCTCSGSSSISRVSAPSRSPVPRSPVAATRQRCCCGETSSRAPSQVSRLP